MHQRVDDPFFTEVRKGLIRARSVPVASYCLGLSGVCDVVEFTLTQSGEGVQLKGREGLYLPAPVEYKRGKPKQEPSDEAQLCAQALCLEEMLSVSIPNGYLYYGATRHRITIALTAELRDVVRGVATEMHAHFSRGYTPRVKPFRGCRSCSLADVCMPVLQKKEMPASIYIAQQLREL
jgi:CRISPR-associated exonuclease Cas4